MPDHVGDRDAVRLDPGASRSPTYQPDERAQTSASEHGDRHSPGSPGPRRRRSSTPGRSSWTRSHLPPESIFPRARHGRSLPRRGELTSRTPTRHRALNREPGRILIPGGGAAGGQGPRTGLPARRLRIRDACGLPRLNDFLALCGHIAFGSNNFRSPIPRGQQVDYQAKWLRRSSTLVSRPIMLAGWQPRIAGSTNPWSPG
jgi:hypothetical protein